MLRSSASIAALGFVCLGLGACHLLLDGQDAGEGTGAGASGSGGSPGQGGAGGNGGMMGAEQSSGMTTDAATTTGTAGYNDACGATPVPTGEICIETAGPCAVPNGVSRFHFAAECANVPDPWCAHYPETGNGDTSLEGGQLLIESDGPTGFWDRSFVSDLEYPTFLFRTVDEQADFVIMTRLHAMTTTGPDFYNMAGIAIRSAANTRWIPGASGENWIKLEYGYRDTSNPYPGLGVLLGQAANGVASHLAGVPNAGSDPDFENDIELAVCRRNGSFSFAFRRMTSNQGVWTYLTNPPTASFDGSPIQLGLLSGAYQMGQSAEARFDWVVFANGLQGMADCEEAIQLLSDTEGMCPNH